MIEKLDNKEYEAFKLPNGAVDAKEYRIQELAKKLNEIIEVVNKIRNRDIK